MNLDYNTLETLQQNHPAWRLLRADHAPLIVSFLNRVYISNNVRTLPQAEIVEALEDELFALRMQRGEKAFPKTALEYLDEWSSNEKAWLRKFYPQNSDEPHYDPTPASEKVVSWLASLTERTFVGTESRLLTIFELLRQINKGSETDVQKRVEELQKRRNEIDSEIAQIMEGNMPMLAETAIKDRFQQFTFLAKELQSDFREVEANFRHLDRKVREKIALWAGSKGELLEDIMGQRDAISDSDQGRSFHAFWDFLMSQQRQEELTTLLDYIMQLPAVSEMQPDLRLRRIHYDWLEAGEYTQRTVAQLSQQIRRFLDDQVWLENKRIMDILRKIETNALEVRDTMPAGTFMQISDTSPTIELPMERPLHSPTTKTTIADIDLTDGDADIDAAVLFSHIAIDKNELIRHIKHQLQGKSQVSLHELIESRPLQHGLTELITYMQLANNWKNCCVDETTVDKVQWQTEDGLSRCAHLPRIIFERD